MTMILGVPLLQPAVAQQTAAEAMAHAIARMMESMGFTATIDQGRGAPLPPTDPMGMSSWPSALGQMPGALATKPWTGSSLEGLWEDNQGGLLIVQGGFYRLYSACRGYIEGEIRVRTDRVELSNRTENFTQTFEFALDQGRLALRDQNGRLYLYRRLILNPSTAR
ncbi:hypothetical protein [Allochromatium tepidum]|uniref:DUF306 domain-containing protein n=1 Tax=Allochromatium tepidum TaxID=553982 RepID=A0ABM7QJ68_9GAMM|nr:hypothetical protein [Allochromatium tepidum]BCU05795.1 hypothetical protein Atep_04720 [Allochromatium tepidum]